MTEKLAPKLHSPEQQQLRLEDAEDMLECTKRDPEFLKTVITGNKSWVYEYGPTKAQLSQWKHPESPRHKESMTGSRQYEGDTDCFFSFFQLLECYAS
jgi:hypothetical protein